MQSKNCSVKDLTKMMKYKSANTISRLITDQSSSKKIKAFFDEFCEKNPLLLVEYEKNQLREAAEVNYVGFEVYTANKQMLNFVRERPYSPACVCKNAFGSNCLFVSTLDDLFFSYTDFASIDLIIQGCAFDSVTRALKGLLDTSGDTKLNIEQYVNAHASRAQEMRDFLSLLDIMGHPNYSFFFSPYIRADKPEVLVAYSNIMIALKCDHEGNKWTDVIALFSEDSFRLLYNLAGEDSYNFNLCEFQDLRRQHIPAKDVLKNKNNLKGMLDYNNQLLEMESKNSVASIRPDISLCMVPPDIAGNVASLLCTEQDEATRDVFEQYIKVVTRRYQIFTSSGTKCRYFFSRTGIYHFLKHGKSKANVFGLRDLTVQERRCVVEGILQVAKEVPTTSFHLLSNDLHYNNQTYLLFGGRFLMVDNYSGFRNYNPAQDYHSCWIHSPHIAESFSSFVESELIEKYACSQEETIAYLQQLLQETL